MDGTRVERDCLGEELLSACANGDVKRVNVLLRNGADVNGEHLLMAVETDHVEIIQCLLTKSCVDPNFENNRLQTPLSIAKSTSAIKLLLQHGAVSDNAYVLHRKACGNVFSIDPLKSLVKIFVIGHGGEGKSTLIEAMKHEPSRLASLFVVPREVEGVSQKTAGIIPQKFKSRFYGDVLFYDFAGYYSGHAAVIKSVVGRCPPIFLLVVSLYRDDSTIVQSVFHWLRIVNQCWCMEWKAPLIVLGSHADTVQSDNEIIRKKQIIQQTVQNFNSFELVSIIPIDCRYSNSDDLKLLRRCVENSSELLRSRLSVSLNSHMFLIYLLDAYPFIPAVTVEMVQATLTNNQNPLTKKQKEVVPFIPTTVFRLIKICDQLNDRGHILFLHNEHSPEKSFIIIDKAALLSEISGTMFAPEDFTQHCQLSTSTGVVPQSKLAEHFPQFNIEMLTKVLYSVGLAIPIDDAEILELIKKHFADISVIPSNDRYLFCPALIRLEVPRAVFKHQPELPFQFGWVKTCTSIEQFFDERFLHILILKIAFSFGLAPKLAVDIPAIQRCCAVWKTGVCWSSQQGVEVLVEVLDEKKVLVLLASYELAPQAFKLRSSVVQKINQTIVNFCSTLATSELVIHPTDVNYPLEFSIEFSLQAVAECIVKQNSHIVSTNGANSMHVSDLIEIEVYAGLGENILQPLLYEADPAHDSVISDRYLSALSASWSKNTKLANILISAITMETMSAPHSSRLLTALKSWRDTFNGTYRSLREVLDPLSVFAGRNPLELAGVSHKNFSEDLLPLEPATNTGTDLSVEDLKRQCAISDYQLNSRIEEDLLHDLAACFDNLETYLDKLALLPADRADVMDIVYVRKQTTAVAMAEALRLWRLPNPLAATFRALLGILLDLRRVDVAVRVCQYIYEVVPKHKELAGLRILSQPQSVVCKPGDKSGFTIRTSQTAKSYQWKKNEKNICREDSDYEGVTTEHLSIVKCFSKHKGSYQCVVVTELDTSLISKTATLKIAPGEEIEKEEAVLLGNILQKLQVDLKGFGVDVQLLCRGRSEVSYEEMEVILKENPATKILQKDLKKELVSRNEEEQLYNEAMANDHKVFLSYTKILALGPGQVGKSTFLYRLLGLMKGNITTADSKTQPQSSTGIAELREAACITYTSRAGALSSGNWYVFDEKDALQTQLMGFMSLINKNLSSTTPPSKKVRKEKNPLTALLKVNFDVKQLEIGSVDYSQVDVDSFPKEQELCREQEGNEQKFAPSFLSSKLSPIHSKSLNIAEVIRSFKKLQDDCKVASDKTKWVDCMLFNVADIGGQPAFLEMLPSLTIGPALYLVFMKLTQGLTERYPVLFKCKNKNQQILCKEYTYTSEEVIFTALSSIACFGHADDDVKMYIENENDTKLVNSLALLVGTFTDKIKEKSELDKIDHSLKSRLEETSFYEDGLIHSTSFLRVNNYNAEETEIDEHRQLLKDLLQNKFTKYRIPTRWLILSICLKLLAQKEGRHDIPFEDCIKLGKQFNMEKDMVKIALQFLHKYIGLVMYFPHHKHLKNVVICDPQVVFSSISELIFDIYDPKKLHITEAQCDNFIRTGCFSPQDISHGKQSYEKKSFLPVNTLIELLVHLNIAAEIPVADDEAKKKGVFFLPAVLQTAGSSLLNTEPSDEQLPEPLCIQFPFGYLPLGFVCALSANLLAESQIELPISDDSEQITYKNKIRFRFQGSFDIVMISCPKYCEFRVSRCSNSLTEFWDNNCCPAIKNLVCDAADRVIKLMQHGSLYKEAKKYNYNLAFKCPLHNNDNVGHEPLAVIPVNQDPPEQIQCINRACKKISILTPEMKMWFGEGLDIQPPTIDEQPAISNNKIKILVYGSKPITYQWFKDKKCVTDKDVEYKGSDTPELEVLGSGLQVKGMYQCLIKNKYGKIWSNESDSYEPFEVELCQKGLKKKVAKALISIGVGSFEDVQQLEESDLKDTNLSAFEKRNFFLWAHQMKFKATAHSSSIGTEQNDSQNACSSSELEPGSAPPEINTQTDSEKSDYLSTEMKDFLKHYNVRWDQFGYKIKEKDIPFLAKYFDSVDLYLSVFDLTPAEQHDVKLQLAHQGTQAAMTKCLSFWRLHNTSSATLKTLIDILLHLGKEEVASNMCSYYYPKCK